MDFDLPEYQGNNFFISYLTKETKRIVRWKGIIDSISEENLKESAKTISESDIISKGNIDELTKYILNVPMCLINRKPYISLFKEISNLNKNFPILFKESVMNLFKNNYKDLEFMIKLRLLMDNGFVEIEDIIYQVKSINSFNTIHYMVIFILFSVEIKEKDEVFYNLLKSITDKLQSNDIKDKNILSAFIKYFEYIGNEDEFIDLVINNSLPNSLLRSIQNDDINSFSSLYEERDSLYDSSIQESDYLFTSDIFKFEKDTSFYCAYYGAVKCFKYLCINNEVDFNSNLANAAAYGGNLEIIQLINNESVQFIGSLKYSILGRNSAVTAWILNNISFLDETLLQEYIHIAIKLDDVKTMKYLLDYINQSEKIIAIDFLMCVEKETKRNIMHLIALNGVSDFLPLFATYDENMFNGKDSDGNTPLHLAVKGGSTSVVQFLISFPLIELNPINKDKATPLCLALIYRRKEISEILLNTNGICTKYLYKEKNMLGLALQSRDLELIKVIIDTNLFSVYDKYAGSRSILEAVASFCDLEISKLIITDDIPINYQFVNKKTFLHFAAISNNAEYIRWLLEEKDADPNVQDYRNNTPLHYAVRNKKHEAIKTLLNCTFNDTHTSCINVNLRESLGETPLMVAVRVSDFIAVKMLLEWEPIVDKSVETPEDRIDFEKKVDINVINYCRQNALSIANTSEIREILISNGAKMPLSSDE